MKTVYGAPLLGTLALVLVLALCGAVRADIEAHGEEYVVRGLVYEGDTGFMLVDEEDALYRLEGMDMGPYLESVVEVVGTLAENEFGEAVIMVSFVIPEDELMDDGRPIPEMDDNAPAQ